MPVDIFWEPGGVLRRYAGHVTVQEREHSFDTICADPRFDLLTYTITDYLAAERYDISRSATEEIAARHIGPLRTNPNIVMAAVVVDPSIIAAIQHFQSLGFVTQDYRIFATLAEARGWIASVRSAPRLPRPRRPL